MKGYKGFSPGMICNGKQYEPGETYEEESAVCCESGFHFCEEPLAVWGYYPVITNDGELTEYAEVEALGEIDTKEDKSCTNKIKIGAKLSLADLIKAEVEFISEKVKGGKAKSGDGAQIGSSGDGAQIGSSGDGAQIGSSGDGAKIGSSGDGAQIGSSGDGAKIGSSGDGAKIGSSGGWAKITSAGKNAVVMAAGNGCQARAKKGSWITLAEWRKDEGGNWVPAHVKTEQVDGERIKEDTFYTLHCGEFVEVRNA